MKVFDCTNFLDEKMMFDLRLNLLNDYVDKFIVAESLFTHAGNKKKQNFNIDDYPKFKDKIIYIQIDKEPEDLHEIKNDSKGPGLKRLNSLKRIQLQYNSLSKGLNDAEDNDLIILSDCDEIPNLKNIKDDFSNQILIFKQKMYYFKFNLLYKNLDWFGSKACKKFFLIDFEWLRYIKNKKYNFWRFDSFFSKTKYRNVKIVDHGGWHFSKVKNESDIFYTLSNYGEHNEFETSGMTKDDLKRFIDRGELYYDHSLDKTSSRKFSEKIKLEKNETYLPKYLLDNQEIYKNWFA